MNCVVKEEDSAAAASTSFHHQFEESSSQKKKKKNGENNKDDGGGGGNNNHETAAVNDNFYNDWKVGNWGWERNYDKYPVSFPKKYRDNNDGINKRRRNEEVQQIKTEPSLNDDEDDGDKKPIAAVAIAVADQPQSVARRLCKSESESSSSSMETRVPILLSCTSIKTDQFSSVKTSDNKPSSIITNNNSNNNIKIKEEQEDDEDIDEGINKDKPKSKNTAISDRTHRKNNSKIKINTDNDSYYDDWEVGNWGWIYDNHKTNTNNNNYDRKDKENIKGDGPTNRNRKRTRDQSDEEEIYDDGDESNTDDDDYNEDTDDDDYEDENDEDKFLSEDNTDFCSNQNKVSRSPAVEGKRRYIDGLKWMRMFQKLVAYKKVQKNTMVPSQYDEDPPLGVWVSHQRRRYKNDKLLPNRITHLNTIGFDWDGVQLIRKENNLQWMKMFQKLVAYKKVHKNTMVPTRYDEDPPLVMWVRYQRRQYKNDKLLPNRITHLNSIDFEWDGVQLVRKENNLQWMKMFQKLVVYKKVHKNTMVPYQYDEDPKLGSWVKRQRRLFKKNKLLNERFDKLDSIGFVWRVLR